ncbi:MAPEG family protein [Dyella caseinilytica]|uniref:MAPEG family protein n=1 Tax=Dyella caseinilytica TaxID=1849581 RepID=A0ABX7GXU0_9GAMM|nr:MAPEG family protein [Dyella caseinilytica]QRN54492.1 MAPEG family protein [Dyella caseinilytica]GFZ94647.1 membrane protein [Dyella caseinilytica]
MTVEMQMLVWSVVLGLVQLAIATTATLAQCGLGWMASPRDGTPVVLTGMTGRLDRANANFLATFVFFAALVLADHLLQRHTAMTVLGAQLYFWARLVYVPVYALGIPYLRTLIWTASIVGIVLLLPPL